MRGKPQRVGTIFYGESWTLETPSKDFLLAIGGGLGWMKWLKNGAEKGFIFHAIIPALGIGSRYGLNILHKFNKGVNSWKG